MADDLRKMRSGSVIRADAMEHDGLQPTLTRQAAERIGYAFALFLAKELNTTTDRLNIAVGYDSRMSGEALSGAFIKGLTAADCDVLACGLSTTPAMFLSMIEPSLACDGAVMVTASKQSWYRNGFILMDRGGRLTEEQIDSILAAAGNVSLPQRLVKPLDLLQVYRERLSKMVHVKLEDEAKMPLLGLHVIVDAGNGAGGFYEEFLRSLGAETTGSRFLEPNGYFPNRSPNPEDEVAIRQLAASVLKHEADLGVMFDADCDLAVLVDHKGRLISGNRLIALLSALLLDKKPGLTIATDSVTSTGLTRFITEWGGIHYRFKRGHHQLIGEAIRLNDEGIDCPLAIETTSHAAFRENYFQDDGMFLVTWLICEALDRKREGLTLTQVIDELVEPREREELRLTLSGEDIRAAGQSVIESILSHTLDNPTWRLAADNREGVRITFDLEDGVDNAWLQLRMSINDPVLVVYAESDVPGGVHTILSQLYALIQDCADLNLDPLRKILGI